MSDSFAQVLRALRDERSITQEELAEKAGITVKAIGALERGERRRPYPHTVRALADGLDLDDAERARLIAAVPARTRGESPETLEGVATPASARSGTLLGREADLASVVAMLRDSSSRVVTLTGPGGVGKTTLALEVAAEVATEFGGGVTVVDLAGVSDPCVVVPAIAAALGLPENGHQGTAAGLAPFLAGRRLLLVLDNLEQLLDAAPQLAELSAHCPELVLLGTSRAPLRIRLERTVAVEPLDADASARLFIDRATAAGGRLSGSEDEASAIAELCSLLDGLPLAIELAASATPLMQPRALIDRLDSVLADGPRDLPERQRAMSTTLDWSYDLLPASAGGLLERLSVIPGGFSLATAESVGGDAALRDLRTLLDHSLVSRGTDVHGTERFRLLSPVRQYAASRLSAADEAAATAGLASAMVDVSASLEGDLRGAAVLPGLDLAEADLPSLRVALRFLLDSGREGDAALLLWRLWLFFALRGHAREGLAIVDDLRDRPMSDHAKVCWRLAAAGTSFVVGDIPTLCADADAALALSRSLGQPELLAEAAVLACEGASFAGNLSGALERLAAADEIPADGLAAWAVLHCRVAEAQVALLAGRLDTAESLFRDCEEQARSRGNAFTVATVLNLRATLAQLRDQHADAARLLAESAHTSVDARISWTFAYALSALASVAVRLGDFEAAATLFGATASWSAAHAVDTGFPAAQALAQRDLAATRDELGDERFRVAWEAGRDTTGPEVVVLAHELSARARG